MPRYRARIPSPWDPDRAFAYMADFSNAAEWDPGVVRASTVTEDGLEPGAAFDLVVAAAGREMRLRYLVTEREPRRITLRALTRLIESEDTITVTPDAGGSVVEYDARLSLRGLARLLNPVLGPSFNRMGRRAHDSLARRLAGTAP
jgi:hypothetical protein